MTFEKRFKYPQAHVRIYVEDFLIGGSVKLLEYSDFYEFEEPIYTSGLRNVQMILEEFLHDHQVEEVVSWVESLNKERIEA